MKRLAALTCALLIGLAGCTGDDGGSGESNAGTVGRLLVQTLDASGVPDGISTIDPDGTVVDEIEPALVATGTTVLDDGRVLVSAEDQLMIVDLAAGESLPVDAGAEPEGGIGGFSVQEASLVPVSQAGSWLLLGNQRLDDLLLVDVETGRATLLGELVDSPVRQASLDPSGEHVTIVGGQGVFSVATADPSTATQVLEGEAVDGAIRADGDRVAYTSGRTGLVWEGAPGADPLAVAVSGSSVTFVGKNVLATAGGVSTIVTPSGEATPLAGEPVERVMQAGTFAILVRGDQAVRVPLDDPATETPVPGVATLYPVPGSRTDQEQLALYSAAAPVSTSLMVVGPTGDVRTVKGFGSFLSTASFRIVGDRVMVGVTDGPRPTTAVLDLRSADVIATSTGLPSRAAAPDGTAVAVGPPTATGQAEIQPFDGSDPVELGRVLPLAWVAK
ncbi:MAG: hypothetical protein ABWZ87_03040 [Aeromicrobium sp.]